MVCIVSLCTTAVLLEAVKLPGLEVFDVFVDVEHCLHVYLPGSTICAVIGLTALAWGGPGNS